MLVAALQGFQRVQGAFGVLADRRGVVVGAPGEERDRVRYGQRCLGLRDGAAGDEGLVGVDDGGDVGQAGAGLVGDPLVAVPVAVQLHHDGGGDSHGCPSGAWRVSRG
ncbi:hypothetical protein SF23_11770 [Streptomyces sp. MBRL 10]|nr:hypothetical protein SF23_11770 [Streptomyces sp. MBRL 10]